MGKKRDEYTERVFDSESVSKHEMEHDFSKHLERIERSREQIVHHLPYLPKEKKTFGEKIADKISGFCGSWTFITIFLSIVFVWMMINILNLFFHWDPYPFILLNLLLSCVAALQAPVILMSQNRMSQRDRIFARYDYLVNRKTEKENILMMKTLEEIKQMIKRKK